MLSVHTDEAPSIAASVLWIHLILQSLFMLRKHHSLLGLYSGLAVTQSGLMSEICPDIFSHCLLLPVFPLLTGSFSDLICTFNFSHPSLSSNVFFTSLLTLHKYYFTCVLNYVNFNFTI